MFDSESNEDADLERLRNSSVCEVISIAPQPEMMTQWTFEPGWYISGSSKQTYVSCRKHSNSLRFAVM